MKILTASQIRELDAYTILHEPVSSIDLMERASRAFVKWFIEQFDTSRRIKIFCGPGNNGGDGLAIARMLLEKFYPVECFVVKEAKNSKDFLLNEKRFLEISQIIYIESTRDIPEVTPHDIVIDALFGSGISRPVTGVYAFVIEEINASEAVVVSVDVASGLFCDENTTSQAIVKSDHTISFQLPKLSFLLPQNHSYVGEWKLMDIGLSKEYIHKVSTNYFYTTSEDIEKLLKPRSKFDHKGTFGKALIVGGSYGMMGAMVLTTRACLRTGAGLCTAYIPEAGCGVLQTAVPECMVLTDKESKFITDIPLLENYDAVGVGPGLGRDKNTQNAFRKLLEVSVKPLVIDADGLNILSEHKDWYGAVPEGSVLTPHPKEFERLAGSAATDYQRLELLQKLSSTLKSVIVLKGAHTAIAAPDGSVYFNSTGNPGMATGGSGDVLTGIITSLIAQRYSSLHAAIVGVYLHGYAGDCAAATCSQQSMLPSDIIDYIGMFFRKFNP